MIHNGFTPNNDDYELCANVENMVLPLEGFFGISAATGALAGMFVANVYKMYCIYSKVMLKVHIA